MQHPDEGLIHAWLDGELDAAEAARVEALVASDPAWAAAAAEARGLIAASARIVGALDRVPANVIPKAADKPRGAARQWMWRAAAALVLVAGSAVVLQRGTPELPAPRPALPPVEEPAEHAAPNVSAAIQTEKKQKAPVALNAPAADQKVTLQKKELDEQKQEQRARDKDIAAAPERASAGAMRADAATRSTAASAGAPAAPPPAQNFAEAKVSRLRPECFVQLEPRDSAQRLVRLEPGALADSVRLEKLTLRGDTLAAVNGRLIALRAPCPAP